MEEINGRYKIRIPCPDGRGDCGVCHYAWVGKDAFNIIYNCYNHRYGRKPSADTVAQIYLQLPKNSISEESVANWMRGRVVVFLK